MSKPLFDRTQGTTNSYLGWTDNQLQRRPPVIPSGGIDLHVPWIQVRYAIQSVAPASSWTDIPFSFTGTTKIYIFDPDPTTGITPMPASGSDPGDVFNTFLLDYSTGRITAKTAGMYSFSLNVQWAAFSGSTAYKRATRLKYDFKDDATGTRNFGFGTGDIDYYSTFGELPMTQTSGLKISFGGDNTDFYWPQYQHGAGGSVDIVCYMSVACFQGPGGFWGNSP